MGASIPPPPPKPSEMTVNVYLNLPNSDSYNDIESMAAPLANNNIKASVEAKDSENKNYNVKFKLNVIDNSINNNDNTTKDYTNNEEGKNIDNNIGQNRYINNLDNNNCNLSQSNNLQDINNNNERNVNEKNNEIKNNEDKYYEKIKENENDNNKEKNNDNNLLKEGVKNMTDFGDGQEESKENNPETNRGNEIDINIGKKDNIYNNNGITNDGEQKDINIGSDYKINEEEEDDKYKGYNYSDSDLIISRIQNISDIKNITEEKTLEQSQDLLEKGLFPLFMELKDYQPLSFFVDKNMTLKTILNIYAKNMTNFDESILNGIKLYCGKRPLDIDEKIQYLNLRQLSRITNFMAEEEVPKMQ